MLGLTCEKDCPELSWDFAGVQLMLFGGLWGALLIGGYSLCIYSITSDTDAFRERVEVLQGRIQVSRVYVGLCTFLSIFQCFMFCLRTFTKTVDGLSFMLEIVACLLYFFNTILSWLGKSLHGPAAITPYMFSRAMIDTCMLPSVVCLVVIEVDGKKGWFSFSFLAALHLLECWQWWLDIRRTNLQVLRNQVMDVTFNIVCLVYFAAMMMMTLENLGDPSVLSSLNENKWNFVSSIYYVFVTISTVGYGDLAPETGLGRLFGVVTIFGGISSVVMAMYKVLQVMNLHSAGGGSYKARMIARHIVVTGNPTINMALDFIAEVFHPDHADDADDLHIVFLLPRGTTTMGAIQKEMRQRKNVHVAPRVHIFQGSPLERHDLSRVSPMNASAMFVLPDMQCKDYMHEDTENIIRMMAVLKVNPSAKMILLLMKAENEQLLHDAGAAAGSDITCLAIDQFKLQLVGKSCQVPGFATLICNLFKTIAETEEEDYSKLGKWLEDYDKGTGNEIYEVELSATYAQRGAVFSEVVLDVIEQTDGLVYLIGLVEVSGLGTKRVLVNPGTWYPIKDLKNAGVQTSGIFIAADREAVQQCEGGVFLGRRERPPEANQANKVKVKKSKKDKDKDKKDKKNAVTTFEDAKKASDKEAADKDRHRAALADMYSDPTEDLIQRDPTLTDEMKYNARKLIQLAKQQRKASEPTRIQLKNLAQGGHILFLCIGVREGEELRLGTEHFLKPLRTSRKGEYSALSNNVPVLIMAPVPPRDWHRVSEDKQVFFMRGAPLSLFDLERANFRAASCIIICHVGSPRAQLQEEWMVDSDIVCCARLIESELPPNSTIAVMAELAVDSNHPFIPLSGASDASRPPGSSPTGQEGISYMPDFCPACGQPCEDGALACGNCGATPGEAQAAAGRFWGSGQVKSIDEYYRQARYACGQLFVGNVVTSLTVNTFFNPSLWELVHQMITAEVVMIPLPRDWEGKSYYEYFDKLLREDDLMPVAIYRNSELIKENRKGAHLEKKKRQWSYVFTTPPAKETHMQKGDRVICFSSVFKMREEDLDEDTLDRRSDEEEEEEEEPEEVKTKLKKHPLALHAALAKKHAKSGGAGRNAGAMMMMH